MSIAAPAAPQTLADVLERLGNVPTSRIRWDPRPGTATEEDAFRVHATTGRLCELVDGVLVEKPMGFTEGVLALALGHFLRSFVLPRNLGVVNGPDGTIRPVEEIMRMPDVAYYSWDRLPGRRFPATRVPEVAPDIAVEVLSPGNTAAEMERKRREYFSGGTQLVWEADPDARTVTVWTAPDQSTVLHEADTLDGGTVLPGFSLHLRDWFAELDRHG